MLGCPSLLSVPFDPGWWKKASQGLWVPSATVDKPLPPKPQLLSYRRCSLQSGDHSHLTRGVRATATTTASGREQLKPRKAQKPVS